MTDDKQEQPVIKTEKKLFRGKAGPGRPKGLPNKTTAMLKEAILLAADRAHPEGLVGYLQAQASASPTAFLSLLGKVLPLQLHGAAADGSITINVMTGVPRADNRS